MLAIVVLAGLALALEQAQLGPVPDGDVVVDLVVDGAVDVSATFVVDLAVRGANTPPPRNVGSAVPIRLPCSGPVTRCLSAFHPVPRVRL